MLKYGDWTVKYVYEDRDIQVAHDGNTLSVSVNDRRYSAVNATLPVKGVQERWYYIVSAKARRQSVDLRMFITWISKEGKELVKQHVSDGSRVLAPYGAFSAALEIFAYGYGPGQFSLSDISVQIDAPYTERKVRICAVSSNINYYDGMCLTLPEAVDYHLNCVDMVGPLNPDVILLTEDVFQTHVKLPAPAVSLEGEEVSRLCEKARLYNTYIVCSLTTQDKDDVYHNTGILINRQGVIQNTFNKTHLSISELEEGIPPYEDNVAVFDTDFGRVGVLICWEHFFPEMARLLALKGAELLLIPTHGCAVSRAISRAMDNGVYLATAHYRGSTSLIVAPNGEVVATGDKTGYAFAEIDLNEPKHIFWLSYPADMIPNNVYMYERREDIYGALSEKYTR